VTKNSVRLPKISDLQAGQQFWHPTRVHTGFLTSLESASDSSSDPTASRLHEYRPAEVAFWRLLETARPGWQKHARWLREHGQELHNYKPAAALVPAPD
jgi:hypothetical protein